MWPLTWLANPVVSFNVLTLLAPALSAWTAFLLARYLTRDRFASFIGGYLFGFSSYELGQLLGHLHMDLIFIVPLLLLFALLAAVVAALWLSESRHGWDRAGRFALGALACLFLMPNPAMAPPWTPLPQEPFFQPQNVVSVLGRDANVIVLPYGNTGPA